MSERLTMALDRAHRDCADALDSQAGALISLAVLSALRATPATISAAVTGARQSGCTFSEIEDVLLQMAAYIGFEAVGAAMATNQDPLSSTPATNDARAPDTQLPPEHERYRRGAAEYCALDADALGNIRSAFGDVAGTLIEETFRIFGDVYASSCVDRRTRQLATLGCLAAAGTAQPQLQFHIGVTLNLGVPVEEIVGVLRLVQVHAGIPAAYNGLIALKAVLDTDDGDARAIYR